MKQFESMNDDGEFEDSPGFFPNSDFIEDEIWESVRPFLGEHEIADYEGKHLPIYQGPLLEALPEILEEEEFYEMATDLPEHYDIDYSQYSAEERIHMVMTATEFFQPFSQHAALEQHLSRILRFGLRHRNPLDRNFWEVVKKLKAQLKEENEKLKKGEQNPNSTKLPKKRMRKKNTNVGKKWTKMLGFTLLGISGIGKTTAFESILSTYPQVIYHHNYKGRNFTWTQIVFVKLDCPHDASLKGLCLNFFKTLDYILGGNNRYFEKYTKDGQATVDYLIIAIAHVAYTHSIGLLVIDEIQRLSTAKSGGSERMMNFFVQLINTVGMPVVLVGTPKARSFVSTEFSQIRRGISGSPYWENLKEDAEWEIFLESLWKYQFTATKTELSPELSHRLYYESAGITDLAVKLYILAQTRAIRLGGEEKITEELIASVAHDALIDAKDMLMALRNRDYHTLESYEDLMLVDVGLVASGFLDQAISAENSKPETEEPSADQKAEKPEAAKPNKIRARQARFVVPANGSLVDIVAKGQKHQLGAYDALKAAGYIKPVSEFMANLAQG